MFTFVGLYAEVTFSSWVRVVRGASAPQPSSSASASCEAVFRDLEPRGAKLLEAPPAWVGVKAGLGLSGIVAALSSDLDEVSPEYLEPDASETLRMIPSGVKSLSVRAVT